MRDRAQAPRGLTIYKILAISPWFHHVALAVAVTAIYVKYGYLPSFNHPSAETFGTRVFDYIAAYIMLLFALPPLWFPAAAALAWSRHHEVGRETSRPISIDPTFDEAPSQKP